MSNYATGGEQYLATIADYYGSIESNLADVAIARGYKTRNNTVSIARLSADSGVSTSTLWYLLHDKTHFRAFNLVTLAKLCHTLHAQPGDLLRYVPGGSSRGLGYSSEAFQNLRGTQQRGFTVAQDSEVAGDERDEGRVSLSDAA